METEKKYCCYYRYHYFYMITNLLNNKIYCGIHSTNNLHDNYMGSGKALHAAYKKYGMDNFKKEIVKFFDTREEALLYESEIVNQEFVNRLDTYNLCCGGNDKAIIHNSNEERLKKQSESNKGKKLSPEHIEKMVKSKTGTIGIYNKTLNKSKYIKKEYLEEYLNDGWCIGGKPVSQEVKDKLRIAVTGTHHTEETKKRCGEISKLAWSNPEYRNNMKEKISKLIWIHNKELRIRKRVTKEYIQEYLDCGWQIGFAFEKKPPKKKYVPIPEEIQKQNKERSNAARRGSKLMEGPNKELKYVKKDELDIFLQNGWIFHKRQHTNETKNKLSSILKANMTEDMKKRISDSLKGVKWIHNIETGEITSCHEEELNEYLNSGWAMGRGIPGCGSGKKYIYHPELNKVKRVNPDEVENYLQQGWIMGNGRGKEK